MTKLFISHASEDKKDFVRPLVNALLKHFDVWYDEFSLKAGDGLRGKIDEGLKKCDFGIVVLSPSFFNKKWTSVELDGLFALEDINRKIIIPIWHNVTESQVREYSPILVSRLAIPSSRSIERIVEDIHIAVKSSERFQEVLIPDTYKQAMNTMIKNVNGWELDQRILSKDQGVKLFEKGCSNVRDFVWNYLKVAPFNGTSKFVNCSKNPFLFHGPLGVSLEIIRNNVYVDTVRDAFIEVNLFKVTANFPMKDKAIFDSMKWFPTCINEIEIAFRQNTESEATSCEKLAKEIVKFFSDRIVTRLKERQHSSQS